MKQDETPRHEFSALLRIIAQNDQLIKLQKEILASLEAIHWETLG